MADANQYSSYQAPAGGTIGGFSTPWGDLSTPGGEGGAFDDPTGWLTGGVAFNDISQMTAPVQNLWSPQGYQADPGAFQLGSQYAQQYGAQGQAAQRRDAPTMQAAQLGQAQTYGGAQIAGGPQGQARAGQGALIQALQQRAGGQAPSLAEMQLRQGQEGALRSSRALAASNPSVAPGLAQRQAQRTGENINLQTNQQAAQLRAQEQQQAEMALGGVLGQVRGQDIGLAGQQAGLTQQAGLAGAGAMNQFALQQGAFGQQAGMQNQQAMLQQQQMNDQMTQYFESLGYSKDQAQMAAQMQLQQMNADQKTSENALQAQIIEANINRQQAAQGGMMAAAGNLVTMISDVRAKEKIKGGGGAVRDILDTISPYSYDYKAGKGDGGKDVVGIMAQDLERTPQGASMVTDTPEGKAIDAGRATQLNLAASADLNRRLSDLESQTGMEATSVLGGEMPGVVFEQEGGPRFLRPEFGPASGQMMELGPGASVSEAQEFARGPQTNPVDEVQMPGVEDVMSRYLRGRMAARTFEPSGPAQAPESLASRTFQPSGPASAAPARGPGGEAFMAALLRRRSEREARNGG